MVFIALGFHRIVCKTIKVNESRCKEPTKLRAQRAKNVLACQRPLRAKNVLRCLRTLRDCVLMC